MLMLQIKNAQQMRNYLHDFPYPWNCILSQKYLKKVFPKIIQTGIERTLPVSSVLGIGQNYYGHDAGIPAR